MKTIQLHPASLLAGVGFASLAFVAMAQQSHPTPQLASTPVTVRPGAASLIAARDMVQIKEGVPYTVPAGKLFVLLALGSETGGNSNCGLAVNGNTEVVAYGGLVNSSGLNDMAGNATSMKNVPNGFAVDTGSVITVWSSGTGAKAWGYLSDE